MSMGEKEIPSKPKLKKREAPQEAGQPCNNCGYPVSMLNRKERKDLKRTMKLGLLPTKALLCPKCRKYFHNVGRKKPAEKSNE